MITIIKKRKISVLTGTISHGATIPLPTGFTADQCSWSVSINNIVHQDTIGGSGQEGNKTHHASVDSSRVVSVYTAVSGYPNTNGTANYIIIGVK